VEKSTMAAVGVSATNPAYDNLPDQEDHPQSDTEDTDMPEDD
jgi:hypothetical protein